MSRATLCLALLLSVPVVACDDDAADLVSPYDPDRLSSVLVIPGARRVSGQPPASSNGDPSAPRLTGGSTVNVTSGGQVVIDLEFESPTGYRNCYIQVEGADEYFVIESDETPTEGRLQIPVDIPRIVDAGSFSLYTCIAGASGAVSNPVRTPVEVTRPSDPGSGGFEYCSDASIDFCAMRSCVNDRGQCIYVVDGNTVECGDCTVAANIQACAERAARLCTN